MGTTPAGQDYIVFIFFQKLWVMGYNNAVASCSFCLIQTMFVVILCHTSGHNDINILETRGSLVPGHPGFPGIRRARKYIFWTQVTGIPLHFLLLILCRQPNLLYKSYLWFMKGQSVSPLWLLWSAHCLSPYLLICRFIPKSLNVTYNATHTHDVL